MSNETKISKFRHSSIWLIWYPFFPGIYISIKTCGVSLICLNRHRHRDIYKVIFIHISTNWCFTIRLEKINSFLSSCVRNYSFKVLIVHITNLVLSGKDNRNYHTLSMSPYGENSCHSDRSSASVPMLYTNSVYPPPGAFVPLYPPVKQQYKKGPWDLCRFKETPLRMNF